MTVVSKYRQLTGEASCDAEAVYFYTGGARFESGPGHCTVTEKFVGFLQAFNTTTVTLRPSGHGRWPPNSVHFIIPQLFWHSTVCSVRHTASASASKMRRNSDASLCASQNCEKRLSVLLSATTRAPTGQIFIKFAILIFFEFMLRKFEFHRPFGAGIIFFLILAHPVYKM